MRKKRFTFHKKLRTIIDKAQFIKIFLLLLTVTIFIVLTFGISYPAVSQSSQIYATNSLPQEFQQMYNVEEKVDGKEGECIYLARRCKMISCLVQPIASILNVSSQQIRDIKKVMASNMTIDGSFEAENMTMKQEPGNSNIDYSMLDNVIVKGDIKVKDLIQ